MQMSELAGAAGPPIPAEVIPQLTATAAQIAAAHEEPAPACIAAVATTRVKALEALSAGSMPARFDLPSYAVVMTGHFASYRGAPPGSQIKLPRRGRCLVAIIDAATLTHTDVGLREHKGGEIDLLRQLGPVSFLTRETPRPSQNL
jgi:hypothetical protein